MLAFELVLKLALELLQFFHLLLVESDVGYLQSLLLGWQLLLFNGFKLFVARSDASLALFSRGKCRTRNQVPIL